MEERIIVSLTTWFKRIQNIPAVLDTIFGQTMPPDLVVLNLAFDEVVPDNIQQYIEEHHIEVNRVPDTKVYKKILPTMKKYPEDCIISIDDDWLYPKGMIEDFVHIHKKYPNNPISGNRVVSELMQCQCRHGFASLVKAEYYENLLGLIDDELIKNCPADDIVWTYLANKAGHPYLRTKGEYYFNMQPYNQVESYSISDVGNDGNRDATLYLINRFGAIDKNFIKPFVKDDYMSWLIYGISTDLYSKLNERYQVMLNSKSYAMAKSILSLWNKIR